MAPPRKPKVGIQRPQPKPAGKPKEKPEKPKGIHKQDVTYMHALKGTPPKKPQKDDTERLKKPQKDDTERPKKTTQEENSDYTQGTEWTHLPPKHLTRSDTQRKDIERVMPKLEELIQKKTKSPTKKLPQWLIHKFQTLQAHVTETDRQDLNVKETHTQMKFIAKNIGHLELFHENRNNKTTPPRKSTHDKTPSKNPSPTASSRDELKQNQDSTNFELEMTAEEYDLESLGQETDTSDMPDLQHGDSSDDSSEDLLAATQDEVTQDNEKVRKAKNDDDKELAEHSSDDTDGARFDIVFEEPQLEHDDEHMFALDTDNITDGELASATTRNIDEQIQNAEQLLDKEVREIEEIHLHTPKMQRTELYEDDDMEQLASQAIQSQWEEKREEMDIAWHERREELELEWNEKREAMELEYKESLEDQTGIQASLVAHETEQIRREFTEMKNGIATSKRTLDEILTQNAILKRNMDNKNRQIVQLQTTTAEIQALKNEMKQEATNLRILKVETREETNKLKRTMQEAEEVQRKVENNVQSMQRNVENNVKSTVQVTIQKIVDTKMAEVEKAIHNTLLKRGKAISHEAKIQVQEQYDNQTRTLTATLNQKTDEIFIEAAALLDQAVLRIGDEMDSAITDFQNTLSEPTEKQRYGERLQKQVMYELRPQITELQEDLVKEVVQDIARASKNAQDDL
jgi:hypothetical protein